MGVDTTSMRKLAEAAPGDRIAMQKTDFNNLLDAFDAGQQAQRTLEQMRGVLDGVSRPIAA